jgi:hypothetical protein
VAVGISARVPLSCMIEIRCAADKPSPFSITTTHMIHVDVMAYYPDRSITTCKAGVYLCTPRDQVHLARTPKPDRHATLSKNPDPGKPRGNKPLHWNHPSDILQLLAGEVLFFRIYCLRLFAPALSVNFSTSRPLEIVAVADYLLSSPRTFRRRKTGVVESLWNPTRQKGRGKHDRSFPSLACR